MNKITIIIAGVFILLSALLFILTIIIKLLFYPIGHFFANKRKKCVV